MTILELWCDHPVTASFCSHLRKNLPSQMNYDACLGSYRCYLSLGVCWAHREDYVALNLAGIGRTPQFAAGTSLSRVGNFTAMQRKAGIKSGRVGLAEPGANRPPANGPNGGRV